MVTQNSMSNLNSGESRKLSEFEKPKTFVDLRLTQGSIWNYWNNKAHQGEHDIDRYLYQGFRRFGQDFLRGVDGRFGTAFHDESAGQIFMCRDWVGEVPLHYYLTDSSLIVANRISDIQKYLGREQFRYEFVRVVPQSVFIVIDALEQYQFGSQSRKMWNVRERGLYYDFSHDASGEWMEDTESVLEHTTETIHTALEQSIRQRHDASGNNRPPAVLLSGGIDSLSVACCLRRVEPRSIAYTLSVGKGGSDVERARQIAEYFGFDFRIVRLEPGAVFDQYIEAVQQSELYHLPNVYCAVGMVALAKALRDDGIETAFCGEGVNEALGDYHDWVVRDATSAVPRLLQRVDHERMSKRNGRVRYVWGREHKEGRYNLQLGSGLAKHGIGRMVKPMLGAGVNLECPYLNRKLMRYLVSIPKDRLESIGGKPGLMLRIFRKEIATGEIPREFIAESQKIRLQDGSEFGEGGITPILLAAGFDQKNTIKIFNGLFGASLNPDTDTARLSLCSA